VYAVLLCGVAIILKALWSGIRNVFLDVTSQATAVIGDEGDFGSQGQVQQGQPTGTPTESRETMEGTSEEGSEDGTIIQSAVVTAGT
jgi:hypothetical protein